MRARNLSHETISGHVESAGQLTAYAAEREADPLDRRTIEEFLAHLSDPGAPATVSVRYRALQQWTRWLAEEDELPADPMAKMPPPQVPEQPVDLLSETEMRRLLASCKGKDYVSRRDHAIFMLLADTGMRLGELARLEVGGSTWTCRSRRCLGRAGGRGRCRSGPRRPQRSTGTCAHAHATARQTIGDCGSVRTAGAR